ncbi:MAG: phage tail assembly protein [Acutalibacter sp.]|nr:phage tail assembly protein [Acutalibacter sp.]
MQKETTTKDEMEQVSQVEAALENATDPGTYTHRLKKPFTFDGKTVEEMHFDFDSLTGADTLAISAEMNRRFKNLVLPHLSWEFMTLMAVRACTDRDEKGIRLVNEKLLQALPMRDYNTIVGKVRDFLLTPA